MSRLLRTAVFVSAFALPQVALANNAVCWGHGTDDLERTDISCIKLTPDLLLRLRGATTSQVLEAMNASGRRMQPNMLHFNSYFDYGRSGGSGIINFTFEQDRVVVIYAQVDDGREYIWNDYTGRTCSDFREIPNQC